MSYNYLFKFLIIGNENVGKTSICKRMSGEQIDLYYQAKQLYERVSGLKQSAEDVVTTASGTINKTKDTVSKLKTSLMTLQKAVKVVIDLAT